MFLFVLTMASEGPICVEYKACILTKKMSVEYVLQWERNMFFVFFSLFDFKLRNIMLHFDVYLYGMCILYNRVSGPH